MAIRPDVIISAGKIDTSDNAYPYGKAQNRSAPGAGDGTNLEADWVNDLWGFLQAILSDIGETPSGSPDEVGASQYLDSMKEIVERTTAPRGLMNWDAAGSVLPASADAKGACWARSAEVWITVGNTDGCSVSVDDGRTWADFSAGMGSTVALLDVAATYDGHGHAVGSSATAYKTTDLGYGGNLGSNWTTETIPGSPTDLNSIEAWDTYDTLIIVGQKAGPQPYIARAASTAGTFTEKTATASFSGKALGSLAIGITRAVIAAASAHTKLMYTIDAGLTWSDSTTTLNSGLYQVTYNRALGKFFAIRTDHATVHYVYSSTDGNTWTLVYSGNVGPVSMADVGGNGSLHGFISYGSAIAIIATGNSGATPLAVCYSVDGGVTWDYHYFTTAAGATSLFGEPQGTMALAVTNANQIYYAHRRAVRNTDL